MNKPSRNDKKLQAAPTTSPVVDIPYDVTRNTAAAAAVTFVSGILFLSSGYKANVENTYSHRDIDRADRATDNYITWLK